jgi:hypothetical protein
MWDLVLGVNGKYQIGFEPDFGRAFLFSGDGF